MRRISRRELLGLGAAAGAVAATGAVAGPAPEAGGSLRLGLAGRGIGAFDGRRPFDPVMRLLGHGAVFDCLTEIAPDGAIAGELADGWSPDPGAQVWTIRLKTGIRFHNGAPFGAADVVATLRWHMDSGSSAALIQNLEKVARVDDHTVRLVLGRGDPGLPFLLADPQLVMLPAGDLAASVAEGIGTGLYRLDGSSTPDRAVLRRVATHHKDGRAGWFDRVEVLVLRDPGDRLEALRSGRVDAINMVDPAWLPALRRHGRIEVADVSGNARIEVRVRGVDGDGAGAIRAAISPAIDRQGLIDRALRGHGVPGHDQPGGPPLRGGAGDPSVRAVDTALARHAVDLSGISGRRVAVRVDAARVPGARAIAHELEAACLRCGLILDAEAPVVIDAVTRPGRPTEDWARAQIASAAVEPLVPAFCRSLIAHTNRLAHGGRIGTLWDMDSARIAERWWRF